MPSSETDDRDRRGFLTGGVAMAVLLSGCTLPERGFERNGSTDAEGGDDADAGGDEAEGRQPPPPEPTSPEDRAEPESQLAFGESHRVEGSNLSITLDTPSSKSQVGRTTPDDDRTFVTVPIRMVNTGDARTSVSPDAFELVLEERRISHDTDPQGALVTGIVDAGNARSKNLVFSAPVGTSVSEIRVVYGDDAVAWREG